MARVVYRPRSPVNATLAVREICSYNTKLIRETVIKTMGTKLGTVGCGSRDSRLARKFVIYFIDIVRDSFATQFLSVTPLVKREFLEKVPGVSATFSINILNYLNTTTLSYVYISRIKHQLPTNLSRRFTVNPLGDYI